MKDVNISKINKMGSIASIVVLISKILLIIAMVGVLIGTICFIAMPKGLVTAEFAGDAKFKINTETIGVELSDKDKQSIHDELISGMNMEVEVDNNTYAVQDVEIEDNTILYNAKADILSFDIKNLYKPFIVMLIHLGITLAVLIFAGRLSNSLKICTTPFEETVIQRMQYFGYSLIPWVLFQTVLENALESFFSGKMQIALNLNLSTVLVVLSILCLTYVFKYGAKLQQESDETL